MDKELKTFEKLSEFLSAQRNKDFLKWLKKDIRRTRLVGKILSILMKRYRTRLTFDEIASITKINRRSLSTILKKLKQVKILSDYDSEKIIQLKQSGSFSYATSNQSERFFYRYRYQLHDLENSMLIIAAVWAICLSNKKTND